ncbi:hypothetical protein M5689_017079 [Euphorbia peplus]|nr:hypothetical protein M5689_017079 [Euphorbia peplus]
MNDKGIPPAYPGEGGECHGLLYAAVVVVPAVIFMSYLGMNAKKNAKRLFCSKSFVLISYYLLLWLAASLNLVWSSLQAWQCYPGKEVAWNLLSLFTGSAMMCLEVSLIAFLLQESYASGLETLTRTFAVSGVIAAVDILFKGIYVFGFGVPLFSDGDEGRQRMKWGMWIIYKLLFTIVYGYILFVHYTKWREKLPPRPAFYNYITAMFVTNAVVLLACGSAVFGAIFGIWLYKFMVVCYHSLYLPFLHVTILADFFQEEDFLLDNAYYSEMRDAGFFDAD